MVDTNTPWGRRRWIRLLGGLGLASVAGCRRDRQPPTQGEGPAQAKPTRSQPNVPEVPPLRLLTYNVLADRKRASERLPFLFDLLATHNADVLALQEVSEWIADLLLQQPWTRAYKTSQTRGPRRPDRGGQLILSRYPIARSRSIELPGRQRRTALISTLEVGGRPVDVATTHLESFLEDGPTRARQLDEIFAALRGPGEAIFCGDLNFGDGEPEEGNLNSRFVDLWTELHPGKPGFTWNIETSDMARAGSFVGESSRRIDRVLVRSNNWEGHAIEIIGDAPIVAGKLDLFPSDHFGLVADLRARPPAP